MATLETILAEPGSLDAELSPKVALYKLFLQGRRKVPANNNVDFPIGDDEASASRNLAAISIQPRIAFLLSAMESFNSNEISQIPNCSGREARNLIDSAGREISAQIRTAVLIIEDEPLITGEVAPAFRTAGLVGGSLLRMALNGAEHDEDTTED